MTFIAGRTGSSRAKYASDLVLVNGLGFLSGVGPIDLDNEKAALPEGVEAQTRRIFQNLDKILAAIDLDRRHVVAVRVHLLEFPRLYDRMNVAYAGHFPDRALPARTCVGVSHLTRGAQIEMDFIISQTRP
ncbi:MAG TPA: RidA family protein [Stellaceae bacterium]|nr:RidA family protein [Stellaceae bacterium]